MLRAQDVQELTTILLDALGNSFKQTSAEGVPTPSAPCRTAHALGAATGNPPVPGKYLVEGCPRPRKGAGKGHSAAT